MMIHFARSLRLRRLWRRSPGGLMIVPLDHAISDGPLTPRGTLDRLVGEIADGGADAVIVHKGTLRHVEPHRFAAMSLIVHLSASTALAPDPDAKYLVTEVEEALRLGADAVSVHINLGSAGEAAQIAGLGRVADACDRWNLPLLAMMYPRGPRIAQPADPALIGHAAIVAAELGADIVKTPFAGTILDMIEVTVTCPIPLIVAGGARLATDAEVTCFVRDALEAGAAGVAMGRNVFQSDDPRRRTALVADLVHLGGTRSERNETLLA